MQPYATIRNWGLLRGVVRVMKSIPMFDDLDVANTMTLHALRFICVSVLETKQLELSKVTQ